MVIIVFGLPGSGKSYFASRLASKLNARYVNSDELRIKMFSKRNYADAEKMLVYNSMLAALSDALSKKMQIVLDTTFYKESIRNKFEQTARAFKEKIIYIEITALENSIESRLEKPRTYSEATFEVYLKLKNFFEPLKEDHLVLISSNRNIASLLRKAIHYINTTQ